MLFFYFLNSLALQVISLAALPALLHQVQECKSSSWHLAAAILNLLDLAEFRRGADVPGEHSPRPIKCINKRVIETIL